MNSCDKNCKICPHSVISTAVTVITVGGTDTLVIDLPAGSTFMNGCKYCIIVTQAIPAAATINMPVAFSIGGDTTTVYPFINCNCTQVTACGIHSRTRYAVRVLTNTASGVFRSLRHLMCYPADNLLSIPAPAVAAPVTPAAFTPIVASTTTRKTTNTTKEAAKNE